MGTNGSTMLEPLRQGLPPIDPSAVSGSATCTLPARYEAVSGARQFTRATLNRWELSDRFDDVALVVSELVTNALRHALPHGHPERPPGPSRTTAPDALDLATGVRGARPQPGEPCRCRGRGLRGVGPGTVPGGVVQRQLGLASVPRAGRGEPVGGRVNAARQGGLGAVQAVRRRVTHTSPGLVRGAQARLRGRDGQFSAIRWSNSPSFTPSSNASISAGV